jgi:hypothetical protein
MKSQAPVPIAQQPIQEGFLNEASPISTYCLCGV